MLSAVVSYHKVTAVLICLLLPMAAGAADTQPARDLSDIVANMKQRTLGPFAAVSWHCADGSVLPPVPYACREHGGGYQHGRWGLTALELREQGYFIGNVLAATTPETLAAHTQRSQLQLTSILIEKFLIAADDGWILRQARFRRGVLQDEDESNAAIHTLLRLVSHPEWRAAKYLLNREAARLLPRRGASRSLTKLRGLATSIAEADEGFLVLRNKIHSNPTADDARRVRDYLANNSNPELTAALEELAHAIDAVYREIDLAKNFRHFGQKLNEWKIGGVAWEAAKELDKSSSAAQRLRIAAGVMLSLRSQLTTRLSPEDRLHAIDVSLAAELTAFTAGREVLAAAPDKTRRQLLRILRDNSRAMFGSGLLSLREWRALNDTFKRINRNDLNLSEYRRELNYIEQASHWAARRLSFYFQPAIDKLSQLDSEAREYIPDRLRGSPAKLHADLIAILLSDAQQLSGVNQEIFGRPVASGLRALNPGIAQGELTDIRKLRGGGKRRAVVITPETTADLPRVAGIVTAEAGNSLSHVQLLARNLNVPNILVSGNLLTELGAQQGREVFIAASPLGVVQIRYADESTNALIATEAASAPASLRPDIRKLELKNTALRRLSSLRGRDSGRTVGPKAARLGELSHHFPGKVSPGLAIPFGVFRALLDSPRSTSDPTPMIEWLRDRYAFIESLESDSKKEAAVVTLVLAELRNWLQTVPLPEEFLTELRQEMDAEFGEDGSFGVFVRSDTNIEDLPNFSGAGLNLTVPNVNGFDNIVTAIRQVWASAFTERSWGWRQAMIPDAEHVYPAVLLHKSVNADKSGVLVTMDIENGDASSLSVVINEGVGGGVEGQSAENLLIREDGSIRVISTASEPLKTILKPEGGIGKALASGSDRLLSNIELKQLLQLVASVKRDAATLLGEDSTAQAADIEFGFLNGKLVLFQIRPFVDNNRARRIEYLNTLDQQLAASATDRVNLDEKPVTTDKLSGV